MEVRGRPTFAVLAKGGDSYRLRRDILISACPLIDRYSARHSYVQNKSGADLTVPTFTENVKVGQPPKGCSGRRTSTRLFRRFGGEYPLWP